MRSRHWEGKGHWETDILGVAMWFRFVIVLSLAFTISCSSLEPSLRPSDQGAEVEEYLIDFSKKIEGRRILGEQLPPDLDAEKFFAILAQDYQDGKFIDRVREYPVRVLPDGESYILILCDRDRKWILFKDLGRTIDKVDYPYGRQGIRIPCE